MTDIHEEANLNDLKEYLKKQGIRDDSIIQYACQIKLFLNENPDYLKQKKDDLFTNLLSYLTHKRCYAATYALKHLFNFKKKRKLFKEFKDLHKSKLLMPQRLKIKKDLKLEERKAIFNELRPDIKLILLVQDDCACRIGALVKTRSNKGNKDQPVRVKHVEHLSNGKVAVLLHEKRGRIITAYLSKCAGELLLDYVKGRDREELIFNIHYRTVLTKLHEASKKVLGYRVSTHWFRYSPGIDLYNRTKDPYLIKRLWNHHRWETTMNYLSSRGAGREELVSDDKWNEKKKKKKK